MSYSVSNGDSLWNVAKNNYGTQRKEETRAKEFDSWTNSEDNFNRALNGDRVEDFTMFDLDLSSYSKDLKKFAQEYIDMWDSDANGVWDKSEFIAMATGGAGVPSEYRAQYEQLFDSLFDNLNIDKKEDEINAGEFASYLYTTDIDWNNFSRTNGDVASSIDGKLDYLNYQTFSAFEKGTENHEILQAQKESFFENYYA